MPVFRGSALGCGAYDFTGMQTFEVGGEEEISKCLFSALRAYGGKLSCNLVLFGDGIRNGMNVYASCPKQVPPDYSHSGGLRFAEFIEKHKLGETQTSKLVKNPLHNEKGHQGYQIWLWYPDHTMLSKWYETELAKVPPAPPAPRLTYSIVGLKA